MQNAPTQPQKSIRPSSIKLSVTYRGVTVNLPMNTHFPLIPPVLILTVESTVLGRGGQSAYRRGYINRCPFESPGK